MLWAQKGNIYFLFFSHCILLLLRTEEPHCCQGLRNFFITILCSSIFIRLYIKYVMFNMFQFLTAYRSSHHHLHRFTINYTHTHTIYSPTSPHQYYCLVIPTAAAAYWDTYTNSTRYTTHFIQYSRSSMRMFSNN